MKHLYLFCIGIGLLLATGCAGIYHGSSGVTTLTLSGSSGSAFTGYVMRDGQRVDVSAVTPWTFTGSGVGEYEFKKAKPEASMQFEALYDEAGGAHANHAMAIPSGTAGVRGRASHHGFEMELLP
jgi:hypothetical protein